MRANANKARIHALFMPILLSWNALCDKLGTTNFLPLSMHVVLKKCRRSLSCKCHVRRHQFSMVAKGARRTKADAPFRRSRIRNDEGIKATRGKLPS